ncbi:hypothetical protein KKG24_03075 [Patescibacteria group bacterium]|nr:hypothetical protein [Patescibacteria group bacterium]
MESHIDTLRNIAKQKKEYKQTEANFGYSNEFRDGRTYICSFEGLQYFLEYVKTLPNKMVLDIGSGDTKAISEIAGSSFGKDLEFKATVLTKNSRIEQYLGYENIFFTSAETLKGVESGSYGGVISCFSVTYSSSPELSISSIDRVLCKNGIFKGVFPHEDATIGRFEAKGPDVYIKLFKSLGYGTYKIAGIMLAIKNGSDLEAQQIFKKDMYSCGKQKNVLPRSMED